MFEQTKSKHDMKENSTTVFAIDPDYFERILDQKLGEYFRQIPKAPVKDEPEWITNKRFMEEVSIKAYNTFVKIRDKMPESLIREINGKQYINRDAVKKYFQGEFSS
jgi:hypothetical protein